MNKKLILIPALILTLIMASCGPAAEDRRLMHERAKIFQDSIATVIRTTLAEAEGPATAPPAPAATVTQTAPAK